MDPKTAVETTGENIEDAIAKGLEQLGVGPSEVLVEVLEEPSRGVFGIGSRPAKVRLQLLGGPRREPVKEPSSGLPVQSPSTVDDSYMDDEDDDDDDDIVVIDEDGQVVEPDEDALVGKSVLEELLHHMDITATITIRRVSATREGENAMWMLDVNGDDMNALIGRRGDTLASLQYITRLITSRHLQRRANLIVDAGGYKSKRSGMLRNLAKRMADQAVKQGRTVTLEPMPPNERRIIHLTLRDHPQVTTRSVGEGDTRKVTIVPK